MPSRPIADEIAFDERARRVPDVDAVAAVVHAEVRAADDRVSANQRVAGAVDVDADEVALDPVVENLRVCGRPRELDAGVERFGGRAGADDGEPADRDVGAGNRDDAAVAGSFDGCARLTDERERLARRPGPM